MNEQEIDALSGRELDLAIERYVFGNEKTPTDKWCWIQKDDGTWWSEQQDCVDGEWLRSWEVVCWPLEYHKSDYLAFKVVDKVLEDDTIYFKMKLGGLRDRWMANFYTEFEPFYGYDSVRAIAICRAALKVVCNVKS